MCVKTKNGYKLSTGKIVSYENMDFSTLTPKEFKELSEHKTSLIETLTIKKDVNSILIGVSELKTMVNQINQTNEQHMIHCPINDKEIDKLILSKLDDLNDNKTKIGKKNQITIENISWNGLKNKIFTGGKLIKSITIFFIFLVALAAAAGAINNAISLVKDFTK